MHCLHSEVRLHVLLALRECYRSGLAETLALPPLELARYIVHEATHARLKRQGIRLRGVGVARVERRCVEEEIAFLERFPKKSEAEWTQWVASKRDSLKGEWWSPMKQRRRMLAALEREGKLKWFTRLVRLFIRPEGPISTEGAPAEQSGPK